MRTNELPSNRWSSATEAGRRDPSGRPRIGFLTYGLDRPLSGVTRVALELGQALNRLDELEMIFLTPYRQGAFRGQTGLTTAYVPFCSRLPGLMLLGGPLLAITAARYQLDLIHDPVGVSPFTLGKWAGDFARIVAMYDAIAFRFPDAYPWLNRALHRRFVPRTLRNVDGVMTLSDSARNDLQQVLNLPPPDIFVVPGGVSDRFRPVDGATIEQALRRYRLRRPYVLTLGARQMRKNLARALAAFARSGMPRLGFRLVIAGPMMWGSPDLRKLIHQLDLQDVVDEAGYIAEADLPALYGGATVLFFPSLYEGFGLPVLEAMACGTPVICSNTSSLPEVAGDAALMVDPTDIDALAEALGQVLTDPSLHRRLRSKGVERARHYSWERTARATADIYRQVLGMS